MPGSQQADAARRVITVPGWWSTVGEAEQAALRTVPIDDIVSACTHALDGIAVATVELMPGVVSPWAQHESPPGRIGHLAELAHENHWSGRAFVFEGQSALRRRMTVAEVVEVSAIDALVLPGGAVECRPGTVVHDVVHCRPSYRDGRLLLVVRPTADGAVEPFERRPPESSPVPRRQVQG